jgi:hypothetical protein
MTASQREKHKCNMQCRKPKISEQRSPWVQGGVQIHIDEVVEILEVA